MQPSEQDRAFAEFLHTLAQARGSRALASLARLGIAEENVRPLQWLGPWTVHQSPWLAQQRLLVAGLFALHPRAGGAGNMGTVFARLRRARGSSAALEKRFIALLEAHGDDLHGHLRRAVGLARSGEIEVHWAQLLADLRLWGHPRRVVQKAWAREFWGAEPGAVEAEHGEGSQRP